MFIGEFLCCLPLLWKYARSAPPAGYEPQASVFSRIVARLPLATASMTTPQGYTHVAGDEDEEGQTEEETLHGWRMAWFWFPAFFDSMSDNPECR